MTDLHQALQKFASWGEAHVVAEGEDFPLGNTLAPPASTQAVAQAWPGGVPPEAAALWAAVGGARLFEDVRFGQWGLRLFSPAESAGRTAAERVERSEDLRATDIVLAEFLGDEDLLVLAPSESGERRLLVALPLDPREDWYGAAPSLAAFLDRYYAASGDKYWE
jgi:hypothetical protein